MKWVIYLMIGLGFSMATPYQSLSEWEKTWLIVCWPAVIARDVVNELPLVTLEAGNES